MSDVLIKGMGMPKDNDYLLLIIQNGKVHKAISCGHLTTDELNVAEAVELPPHGRLIDADKFHKRLVQDIKDLEEDKELFEDEYQTMRTVYQSVLYELEEEPTILKQITGK